MEEQANKSQSTYNGVGNTLQSLTWEHTANFVTRVLIWAPIVELLKEDSLKLKITLAESIKVITYYSREVI